MGTKHSVVRRLAVAVVAAGVGLGMAACSSGGGREEPAPGGGGGQANTPTMTVAFISHGAPGDTFWDLVRKGAEDAAAKDNIQLEYSSDPDGANQANLVQTAIDRKVDGIAVTLAKPEAMQANVKAAAAAGIPVTGLNSGMDTWQDFGMVGFFGQDETVAGEAAGQRMKADGAKKAVCVIHEQGNVGLESRCDGAAKAFGPMEKLYVTGTDMPGVQAAITSKLQQDASIDTVLTLGAPFALTAVQSVGEANREAKVATFDTNAELVDAIKNGEVAWAVDQQPYLQGYLAVDALWLYKTNGNTIGGGEATFTGPAFVDQSNVDAVAEFAKAGKR